VIGELLRIVENAYQSGYLVEPDKLSELSGVLAADLTPIRAEFGLQAPDWVLVRVITVWTGLFGAVSAEVFEMYGAATFADMGEIFECQLDNLCALLGLTGADGG
jgi:hypothetical protein